MRSVSILNDVLGPVMRGPSSSHTAGSYHIGRLIRSLAGDDPASAVFTFDPDGILRGDLPAAGRRSGLGRGPSRLGDHRQKVHPGPHARSDARPRASLPGRPPRGRRPSEYRARRGPFQEGKPAGGRREIGRRRIGRDHRDRRPAREPRRPEPRGPGGRRHDQDGPAAVLRPPGAAPRPIRRGHDRAGPAAALLSRPCRLGPRSRTAGTFRTGGHRLRSCDAWISCGIPFGVASRAAASG